MGRYGRAERSGEAAALQRALGARATADVGAAPGQALGGVAGDLAVGDDDALQLGLRSQRAAADAAAPGRGYDCAPLLDGDVRATVIA
jgi:hypothetical protein